MLQKKKVEETPGRALVVLSGNAFRVLQGCGREGMPKAVPARATSKDNKNKKSRRRKRRYQDLAPCPATRRSKEVGTKKGPEKEGIIQDKTNPEDEKRGAS